MESDHHMYDVCIIGAGVVGCAIARELSRYRLDVLLVEKENDVANQATKANSGIVHGGYSARHGSARAFLCRRGNRMYEHLDRELKFGFRETGSLVLAFDRQQAAELRRLLDNGRKNGVTDLEILNRRQTVILEPNVNEQVVESLHCPSAGVASPYEFAIALAENAVRNGVQILLQSRVTAIEAKLNFTVELAPSGTGQATGRSHRVKARFVVNASGLYADRITAMVTAPEFAITPRQGQYIVFQKGYGSSINTVIFQTPSRAGKGILVTPTYHGNLMIGPNANEIANRENVNTDKDVLASIVRLARKSVPNIDLARAITTFAGVRATSTTGDFIIGKTEVPKFIQAAGIDSPGLTASPAIAEAVRDLLADSGLDLREDSAFNPRRAPIIIPKSMTDETVKGLLGVDSPDQIICRCERVSRREIEDAMGRGIPVLSIDAVKRRTRAGQGKCQGAFCRPRVAELLGRRLDMTTDEMLAQHERESAGKSRIHDLNVCDAISS